MLLLMRRVGEALRVNENITIEVKEIKEDKVIFSISGVSENETLTLTAEDSEMEKR